VIKKPTSNVLEKHFVAICENAIGTQVWSEKDLHAAMFSVQQASTPINHLLWQIERLPGVISMEYRGPENELYIAAISQNREEAIRVAQMAYANLLW